MNDITNSMRLPALLLSVYFIAGMILLFSLLTVERKNRKLAPVNLIADEG
jgi:hypothetical protein